MLQPNVRAKMRDRHHAVFKRRMHWATAFVVEKLLETEQTQTDFMARVGLSRSVFHHWRNGIAPTMQTLEPALHALGYKLAIVPLTPEDKP